MVAPIVQMPITKYNLYKFKTRAIIMLSKRIISTRPPIITAIAIAIGIGIATNPTPIPTAIPLTS